MHAAVPALLLPAEPDTPGDRGPAARLAVARAAAPGVVPASRLEVRPAPEVVSTGIAALDALTGGLPRGALTEVFGAASSGRTSLLVSVLAAMTARGELCALVDASDSFAPESARAAGVELARLLWIRGKVSSFQFPVSSKNSPPRRTVSSFEFPVSSKDSSRGNFLRLEQALKTTDLLLQGGGFGLVAVDLGDLPPAAARRVPLTSWFRFRRAVENTPTVLLLLARESCAKTCASIVLGLRAIGGPEGRLRAPGAGLRPEEGLRAPGDGLRPEEGLRAPGAGCRPEVRLRVTGYGLRPEAGSDMPGDGRAPEFSCRRPEPGVRSPAGSPSHAELLTGISIEAELVRSRLERKAVRAASIAFDTRAQWA